MRLSIAMATYNASRFLQPQLESIAGQQRLPDELVVCDNASTDDTVAVLNAFREQAPFPVRIERNSVNLGCTKNFEKAVGLCEGDIIALADSDDVWYAHKLARLMDEFSASEAIGAAFSDADIIDEHGQRVGPPLWQRGAFGPRQQSSLRRDAFRELLRGARVTGMTMVFRARYRPRVLPIPTEWHHDAWISLLISILAELRPVDERLVRYRQHAAQDSGVPCSRRGGRPPLSARAERYRSAAQRYEEACERVRSWNDPALRPDALPRLKEKVRHLRWRAVAQTSPLNPPGVLAGLLTGRYHRCSTGLRAAVADLIHYANPGPRNY
ncbi:MAG: glycosyltransferase family 2 protein [Armatimonadetes bacterium]|nr:glycosyltransferase family 2 protein [Armatimonadota bacterium]